MKSLSLALQAHLDDGTTTLSWCWRISRADGWTLGFTDHDRVLTFDGTDFEPESGFAASEVRSGSDLSVDAQDAEGVLTSDRITETDIVDGRWDAAQVELWRVNWAATSQRVLLRRGAVGQIRRGRMAFVAEVRSLVNQALHGLGDLVQFPLTQGAFYVLMKLPGVTDAMALNSIASPATIHRKLDQLRELGMIDTVFDFF